MTDTPRGIRNNNPFNIVANGVTWGGLASPPDDGRFCRFTTPEYGIRAGCKLLLTYQDKYGLRCVLDIITRFAPSNENDTESYIQSVATGVGVGRAEPIDLHRPIMLRLMAKAIIRHENGTQPYDDATIDRALALAGVQLVKPADTADV